MRWDDPKLHKIAGEFFRTFSRMEYALKAAGFMVENRRNAEADWGLFATAIGNALVDENSDAVREAVAYIRKNPPKKQVNIRGLIQWDKTPPRAANDTELILRYVCRVRNNLFHGGKFNGRWFEPQRSGELIHASLIILNFCRQACPDVDRAFHS
jgi:hypothetical protein